VGHRTGLDRCGKSRTHRDSIPEPSTVVVQLLLLVSILVKVLLYKEIRMVYWYYVTLLGNFIVQSVQKEVQPIENAHLLVNYKKKNCSLCCWHISLHDESCY